MNDSEVVYGSFCCALQVAFPVIVLIKKMKAENIEKGSNVFRRFTGKTLWCVFIIILTGIREKKVNYLLQVTIKLR